MEFRTKVALPKEKPGISHESEILLLGSCFAEHIGQRMLDSGLNAEVNPFGVLYNPESIALALECILQGSVPESYLFQGRDGLWHSRLHAGDFSAATKPDCQEKISERLLRARQFLKGDVLCITWGTALAYRLRQGNFIVGNCHKEASADFEPIRLGVEDIARRWGELTSRLLQVNPSLQLVFTVSPYRYASYGLHESQLSKAILHLAIDELCRKFPQCHYFPAYEIVVDELRDYRFYDADMLHPSAVAVEYVWERFADWCFAKETKDYINDYGALIRDARHRPLHPETEAYADFLRRAELRKADFERKWGKQFKTDSHND